MATIIIDNNGTTIKDSEVAKEFLKTRGLEYRHWTTKQELVDLTQKESLEDSEKEILLEGLDNRFQELKEEFGYTTRDLIVLHPKVPGLADLLSKFDRMHYHTDDEVRYIVDGSGIFGFDIRGEKFLVHVESNDFIAIPKNTHHWFKLDENMRIKAVRYFIDTSGWTPHYV